MKLFTFLTAFLLLSFNYSMASVTQDSSKCVGGGTVEHTVKFEKPHCLLKSRYSTVQKAFDRITEIATASMHCENNCTFAPKFNCKPEYGKTLGYPDFSETETHWCFSGTYKFSWECGDCEEVTSDTDDTEREVEDLAFSFSEPTTPKPGTTKASLQKIYPNPSNGILYLDLDIDQADSKVLLLLSDLSGKTIQQEEYNDVPRSVFHIDTDVSGQQNGLYLLSVYVNEQLIGTSKVSIQK